MTIGVLALSGNPDTLSADRSEATRAAAGDARAFERLYRANVDRIHSLARRMIGTGDAGEITQDIFTRAWQKLGTYRGEAAFGTWLYRIAINVIMEKRAGLAVQRARYHQSGEEALEMVTVAPVQSDSQLDFEAALERLPAGAREVLVLHDVEGYKHEEISGLLGITAGTSKSQLHRARMALRRYLEP